MPWFILPTSVPHNNIKNVQTAQAKKTSIFTQLVTTQHPMFYVHIVSQGNLSIYHFIRSFFFLFVSALALFPYFLFYVSFFSIFSSFLILYIDEENHINKKGWKKLEKDTLGVGKKKKTQAFPKKDEKSFRYWIDG